MRSIILFHSMVSADSKEKHGIFLVYPRFLFKNLYQYYRKIGISSIAAFWYRHTMIFLKNLNCVFEDFCINNNITILNSYLENRHADIKITKN